MFTLYTLILLSSTGDVKKVKNISAILNKKQNFGQTNHAFNGKYITAKLNSFIKNSMAIQLLYL